MIASRKSILTALGLAENLMNIEKDDYRNPRVLVKQVWYRLYRVV